MAGPIPPTYFNAYKAAEMSERCEKSREEAAKAKEEQTQKEYNEWKTTEECYRLYDACIANIKKAIEEGKTSTDCVTDQNPFFAKLLREQGYEAADSCAQIISVGWEPHPWGLGRFM